MVEKDSGGGSAPRRATVSFASDKDTLMHIWSQASDAGSETLSHSHSDGMSKLPSEAEALSRRRSSAAGDKELLNRKASQAANDRGALLRKKSSGAGMLMRKKSIGAALHESIADANAAVSAAAGVSPEEGEATLALRRRESNEPDMRQAVLIRAASTAVNEEEETVFESAEEAARLHDVVFTFATMEALDMGDGGGAVGGLVHLHNATRCEIESVVTMLCAMRRLGAQLTVGDLIAFRKWWEVAAQVFEDCIELECKVVLPWLREYLTELPVEAATAPVEYGTLRKLIGTVGKSFDRAIGGNPRAVRDERMRRERLTVDLMVSFDRLITRSITHMHSLETALRPLLVRAVSDERAVSEQLLGLLMTECVEMCEEKEIVLHLLGRWVSDGRTQRMYSRLVSENTEFSGTKLASHYELNHGATVAVFKVRSGIR